MQTETIFSVPKVNTHIGQHLLRLTGLDYQKMSDLWARCYLAMALSDWEEPVVGYTGDLPYSSPVQKPLRRNAFTHQISMESTGIILFSGGQWH